MSIIKINHKQIAQQIQNRFLSTAYFGVILDEDDEGNTKYISVKTS